MNPKPQGTKQIFRDLRSEVTQLKASAVPPNLTRNLEAKVESQKFEIQSLQRDLQTTLDPIQGTCVDERVCHNVTMIQQNKTPRAWGDPRAVSTKRNILPKTASKLAAAWSTPPARFSNKLQW